LPIRRIIGLAKKKKFNQERNIGLAKKKKFNQEEI
jgi:hypothetical protein